MINLRYPRIRKESALITERDDFMKIAIVDDEKEVRNTLEEYIRRFSRESSVKMETAAFSSGDSLMEHYKMIYDIIIFDIDMPGTNGMDTARKLRELDSRVTIIFITNVAQYAINGYEVGAVDYIIKPISYYDFSMKFHRTVAKAAQQKEHTIMIDTMEGLRRLKVSSVIYVDVLSHYLHFHTGKNVYTARGSMKDLENELSMYDFVRVHKSYLVNMKYVDEIQPKEILAADERIPLGRGYKESVMQAYMRYVRGE